jgi:hypothetical protein
MKRSNGAFWPLAVLSRLRLCVSLSQDQMDNEDVDIVQPRESYNVAIALAYPIKGGQLDD